MNLSDLKVHLSLSPDLPVAIRLPGGRAIPAHFHITEIGHVTKEFVDCGGTLRTTETCLLQTWAASPKDDGHRLTAAKLGKILALGARVLPTDELPVEVEYEDGAVSQFSVEEVANSGAELQLRLGLKHTDCLAKERCGVTDASGDGDDDQSPALVAEGGCCSVGAGGKCCG